MTRVLGRASSGRLATLAGAGGGRPGGGGGGGAGGGQELTLNRIRAQWLQLMSTIQGSDFTPTLPMITAVEESRKTAGEILDRWRALKETEVKALNDQLRQAGLPVLSL